MHAALVKEIGEDPDKTEERFRKATMAGNAASGTEKGKRKGKKKSAGKNEG